MDITLKEHLSMVHTIFPMFPVGNPVPNFGFPPLLLGVSETRKPSNFAPCPISDDTVKFITAWQVIPKQAATRDFPKYGASRSCQKNYDFFTGASGEPSNLCDS